MHTVTQSSHVYTSELAELVTLIGYSAVRHGVRRGVCASKPYKSNIIFVLCLNNFNEFGTLRSSYPPFLFLLITW